MPAISVLIKPSSGMCNMHCDYCFYCDEAQKRLQKSYGFMSEETLKNVIRKTCGQKVLLPMLFRAVSLPFGELISLRKPLLMKPSITDTIYRSAMHYRQTDICWTMNGAAF